MDLSDQWDLKSFSVAVGGNEVASVRGRADVHPFTYGARGDVMVFPFLNVFATVGGVKLNVGVTGFDVPLGVSGVPPEVIRGDINFDLDFTGYYGGRGFVLMYAYQNFFTSIGLLKSVDASGIVADRCHRQRVDDGHRCLPRRLQRRCGRALYRWPLG